MMLPPGKYYIGDPCYVLNPETWKNLLKEDVLTGEIIEFQGYKLWSHTTMHGDGLYTDQYGNEFPVDSGTLAAVPIELLDDPSGEEDGLIIDAPEGMTIDHDNGTFWFGNTVIKTGADDDFDLDDEQDAGYDGDLDSELDGLDSEDR